MLPNRAPVARHDTTPSTDPDSLEQIARDLQTTHERIMILALILRESGHRGEAAAASNLAAQIISVSRRVERVGSARR